MLELLNSFSGFPNYKAKFGIWNIHFSSSCLKTKIWPWLCITMLRIPNRLGLRHYSCKRVKIWISKIRWLLYNICTPVIVTILAGLELWIIWSTKKSDQLSRLHIMVNRKCILYVFLLIQVVFPLHPDLHVTWYQVQTLPRRVKNYSSSFG